MKRIVLIVVLASALLCSGCADSTTDNPGNSLESSIQISSSAEESSYTEDDYIEVVAGDFVFKVPKNAKLADSSKDGLTSLNYSVQEDGGELGFSISYANQEDGQKIHNSMVDFMGDYGNKMTELARMLGETGEVDLPDYSIETISVDSIGGKEISLGAGWEFKSESYSYISLSCFVGDKYYNLEYEADNQIYSPEAWQDFLSNIRPL